MHHRGWLMLLVAAGCADAAWPPSLESEQPEPDAAAAVVPAIDAGVVPDADAIWPLLTGGEVDLSVPAGGQVGYRLEAAAGEHVSLFIAVPAGTAGPELSVYRDGVRLGYTSDGAVRTLAVLDAQAAAQYRVAVRAVQAFSGTLRLTRTPFADGVVCQDDCARLLQLPLPNDPGTDGYDVSLAIMRYQFGRRDLLMFLRRAARLRSEAGDVPFRVADISQWDGQTPGVDVGAPRHLSHQRGKDVDISLYGLDHLAPFRSYCTVRSVTDGYECVAGTRTNFDGVQNARVLGAFFESGRVTMSFLDNELIAAVKPGATTAAAAGDISDAVVPLFGDGVHLQHWPNHTNHIHVRVSETAYGTRMEPEPFEAP